MSDEAMWVNDIANRYRTVCQGSLQHPHILGPGVVPPYGLLCCQVRAGSKGCQLLLQLRAGATWRDNGLIFATTIGTPLDAQNVVNRHFKPLLRRSGLPNIRWHDLRHTAATLLLTKGVHPKLVQHLLGHASISMTLGRYSHWMPSMGRATASAMDDALVPPTAIDTTNHNARSSSLLSGKSKNNSTAPTSKPGYSHPSVSQDMTLLPGSEPGHPNSVESVYAWAKA